MSTHATVYQYSTLWFLLILSVKPKTLVLFYTDLITSMTFDVLKYPTPQKSYQSYDKYISCLPVTIYCRLVGTNLDDYNVARYLFHFCSICLIRSISMIFWLDSQMVKLLKEIEWCPYFWFFNLFTVSEYMSKALEILFREMKNDIKHSGEKGKYPKKPLLY